MTAVAHHIDCGWHLDQYPFECTCGAIGDADLLRAQLMGVPLPNSVNPQERATFNRRPAMPKWPPPGYHQLPDGERCRCMGMLQRAGENWCCGQLNRTPPPRASAQPHPRSCTCTHCRHG